MQFFLLIFANRWFKSQRLMSRPKGITLKSNIIFNVKIGIIIANIYRALTVFQALFSALRTVLWSRCFFLRHREIKACLPSRN